MSTKHKVQVVTKNTDGSANTKTINIPKAEMNVLLILKSLGEATGPAIARNSNNTVTSPAVYKLLHRLVEREVLERNEFDTSLTNGSKLKQVFYKIKDGVELPEIKNTPKMVNLSSIAPSEQECFISSFWSMLKELEHQADSKEASVILRHEVTGYYKQWNRVTGDNKQPIWVTRSKT